MRLIDKILVLFLVTSGIHRVDLFADKAGFVMLPVLAVSLFFIPLTVWIISTTRKVRVHNNIVYFIVFQAILCAWLSFTVIDFKDFLQIKRLILFFIISAASSCFLILFYQSNAKKEILIKFIKYSFYVYVLFSVIQVYFFLRGNFGATFVEPFAIMILNPPTIGHFFPRLTGGLYDPNVGGYFLTFLFFLNRQIWADIRLNKYIALLILLTLSRSAIVAFILILLLERLYRIMLDKRRFVIKSQWNKKVFYAFLTSLTIFIASMVYIFMYTNIVPSFVQGVEARLFNKDNSTSIHLGLFQIAIDGIFHDPWHFLKGYGFSSSFLFTQEYFPGNKYGNFHSELITIFFETGFIGLILYVLILSIPTITLLMNKLRPNKNFVLIGIALFLQGIFYQQYLFQYYWIMIALLWILPALKPAEYQNTTAR